METIGKYQIIRKLGQGGMGIVYLCHDPETGQKTAVKVLPQQLAGDPVFFQRFKREVQTLQRLDHPGIVRICGRGVHDGAPWYAMEFIEGTSLADILKSKEKMAPLRAIAIIRACAEALQHSHSLGVIHRDIKPANIMIADDGAVKLMDFGIAKVLDATRMTATQGVLGTIEFMSPEQSQGRRVDTRTDLYSLGAVLYLCLTARLPISGATPSEVVLKLRTHQVESPDAWVPDLPGRLTQLVTRLLHKDPLKRPESAQELIRELDRIRRQIEHNILGRVAATTSERVISSGRTRGYPLLRSPWLYLFFLAAAAVILFAVVSGPKQEEAANSGAAPAQNNRMRIRLMKVWVKKDIEQKRFDRAEKTCKFMQEHFSDAAEKENVAELLQNVQKARTAREAEDIPETTPGTTKETPNDTP